ncbi:MAG: DNA polymerase III subunit gamma/tau [Elusimicrobia bacterium]|nr:DNA polymerase III subunit gamma/tau [Elusimicrobiota bacterium]
MSYLVLARKYRPQSFEEVVGQEAICQTLKNALIAGRLAHAYLFFGSRGIGKTTTARLLAKALNCTKGPTAKPCNQCASCQEVTRGNSLDVMEMDAASHTGVDHVREVILDTVALAPSRDRYKVFIIDEAHMLSTSAFNAFLKTLEEPPSHVVFILATTEPSKIPATIFSRCQRFRFRSVPVPILLEHLKKVSSLEKFRTEPAALELIAKTASGSLRDAVSLLDQVSAFSKGTVTQSVVEDLLGRLPEDLLLGMTQAVLDRNTQELWSWLEKVYEEGYEPLQLIRDLRDQWERVYLDCLELKSSLEGSWKELASKATAQDFSYLLRRLNRIMEELKFSDSPRTNLEMGLLGLLETAYDLEDWVRRLENLEKRLSSGTKFNSPLADVKKPQSGISTSFSAQKDSELSGNQPQSKIPASPLLSGGQAAGRQNPKSKIDDAGLQMPLSALWEKALGLIRKERPSLGGYLQKARLEWDGVDPECRVFLSSSFEKEGVQRQLGLVEEKVSGVAGRKVRVRLEVDASGALAGAPAAIVDEGWEEENSTKAKEKVDDPEIQQVLDIFPGRVVKKKDG